MPTLNKMHHIKVKPRQCMFLGGKAKKKLLVIYFSHKIKWCKKKCAIGSWWFQSDLQLRPSCTI